MGNLYDVVVFCSHRETDEETGRRISYKSPLLSWTAHRGWCSQTQFPHHRLPRLASKDDTASRTGTSAGNANTNSYLLTAGGMDGTVCLWDLSGEFILIVAWAIQLTSCFVVTVYVSRRAWAKTGGTSAAEQARGVQQRRGERALSWGGDQWGADDTQPVAEPRQEGRRSERRLIPTAGGVRELLGN